MNAVAVVLVVADAFGMHDGDVGVGWWIVMMLGMVLFWGLIALAVVWLVRELASGRGGREGDAPLKLLDRRLAEGEISVEEYEERRHVLTGGG
jgi:putative membrane protein